MTCATGVGQETFERLTPRWTEMLARKPESTVFDLPSWQSIWWEHFGEGQHLRLLTVAGPGGEVELIAPLVVNDGTASFLGGTDLVDYHEFISPAAVSEFCLEAMFRQLTSGGEVRAFRLESIPEKSPSIANFRAVAEKAGWHVEVEQEDVAPRLELPADWDSYVAGLRKKDRHELRRKLRRLEAAGEVDHIELTSPGEIDTAADEFFRLHRMSMPDKADFMTPERECFFRDVAGRLAEEGVTRLCFLRLNGENVATSLSFVAGGVRYLYNSGYDPRRRQLAVGLLNHAYTIRRSIEQGHNSFDFMRGDESYKYHLGGVDRRLFRLTATKR